VPRAFAIGDPQGPFRKVLDVLARHGLLAGDRLARDVTLISVGDHFDYDPADPDTCAREGVALLRWLASHDREQARILLGNHDAARVMEFATIDDAEFAFARTCDAATYAKRFAALPPQHVLQRDYAAFTTEQRALVQQLLAAGRLELAVPATLPDGRKCLVTHAGVTKRELSLLDLADERAPRAIAVALNQHLARGVARGWPLSLAPLHVTGGDGLEGGGLLYHRPSNPACGSKFDGERPRRFDPRTLPAGLTQVAGHSGHHKLLGELGPWATPRAQARSRGGIRSIAVQGDEVTYDLGTAGDLILIDGELRRVPADEVDLLELATVSLFEAGR
jgi:hypothetical protein